MMVQAVTGKQMCELIAEHWHATEPRMYPWDGTPEAIWNHSPRGELFMVFEWYEDAQAWKAAHTPADA